MEAVLNNGSTVFHLRQERLRKAEHGEDIYAIRFLELAGVSFTALAAPDPSIRYSEHDCRMSLLRMQQ